MYGVRVCAKVSAARGFNTARPHRSSRGLPQATSRHEPARAREPLWLPDVGADETRLQEALRRALQVQTFDEA